MRGLAYLVQRYVLRRRFLTAQSGLFDAKFRVVTADFIGRRLYKRGVYEPANIGFLQHFLRPKSGDILLDVGANLGWYSVLFDRLSPEGVEILAFEPDPLNFELLTHNLRINGCGKVTPVQCAVSDARRTCQLYLYPDKNRGRHSLIPSEGRQVVDVEAVTLDEYLGARARRVRFLKLDIEGHEHEALLGARQVLGHVAAILMEFSPGLYARAAGREAVLALLFGQGFIPHTIDVHGLTTVERSWLGATSAQVDLFWTHPERNAGSIAPGGAAHPTV